MKSMIQSRECFVKLCRIIIPTRNSSKWLKIIIDHYKSIGLSPLFIADVRSIDNTLQILAQEGAEYVTFEPKKEFAEDGMIEFGSRAAGTEWVLRLDDDEFPSLALLNWVKNVAVFDKRNCWGIPRRDVGFVDGAFKYSRWPTRIRFDGLHNPLVRMHRVNNVEYIHKVHTSGFKEDETIGYAPNECFFIHVNNVLRSFDERLAKVRQYAALDPIISWQCVDECLWEVTGAELHSFSSDGLDEFIDFLQRLPRAKSSVDPMLSREESLLMDVGLFNALRIYRVNQEALKSLNDADKIWLNVIPLPMLKIIAEALLTGGGVISLTGTKIFKNYDLRKNGRMHT
jgi:glycosyltransferase involved in cell wall biosynthesis